MNGKFIIGITGNIATGKSVVRKMLENLGAFTIDADLVTHSAMESSAPGFKAITNEFGHDLIDENGEIDRKKLAEIVFNDSEKLELLETIIHPLVRKAVKYLIERSTKKVIAIEAIKLFESPLVEQCNSIWVVSSELDSQRERIASNREMTDEEVNVRLANQSSQDEKILNGDIIIKNDKSLVDTWKQVLAAWTLTVVNRNIIVKEHPRELIEEKKDDLQVVSAMPKHAGYIARFLNVGKPEEEWVESIEILERFGDRAYSLLIDNEEVIGLIGWQVEDLVTQADRINFGLREGQDSEIRLLLEALESSSETLNSEVILIKIPDLLVSKTVWQEMGYEFIEVEKIKINIWKNAAKNLLQEDHKLVIKKIRSERVFRPM